MDAIKKNKVNNAANWILGTAVGTGAAGVATMGLTSGTVGFIVGFTGLCVTPFALGTICAINDNANKELNLKKVFSGAVLSFPTALVLIFGLQAFQNASNKNHNHIPINELINKAQELPNTAKVNDLSYKIPAGPK